MHCNTQDMEPQCSLQAALQTAHIKHFWEQYPNDLSSDVEQTEALLMTSLQVYMLADQALPHMFMQHSIADTCQLHLVLPYLQFVVPKLQPCNMPNMLTRQHSFQMAKWHALTAHLQSSK